MSLYDRNAMYLLYSQNINFLLTYRDRLLEKGIPLYITVTVQNVKNTVKVKLILGHFSQPLQTGNRYSMNLNTLISS